MPHVSIFWGLDYHRSLYVYFIIHLRASESKVSHILTIILLTYCWLEYRMSKVSTFWELDYHMSRVSHISSINRLGARLSNVPDFNLLIAGVPRIPCINPLEAIV